MITSFKLANYGPIKEVRCSDLGNINILIGGNGSGKTTVLKALYAGVKAVEQNMRGKEQRSVNDLMADKLYWTFQPEQIGDIVRKGSSELQFLMTSSDDESLSYIFGSSTSKKIIKLTNTFGARMDNSIFIPAKEVLSLQSVILESRSDKFNAFGFDDTYYDLARALKPRTRGKTIRALPMYARL